MNEDIQNSIDNLRRMSVVLRGVAALFAAVGAFFGVFAFILMMSYLDSVTILDPNWHRTAGSSVEQIEDVILVALRLKLLAGLAFGFYLNVILVGAAVTWAIGVRMKASATSMALLAHQSKLLTRIERGQELGFIQQSPSVEIEEFTPPRHQPKPWLQAK